MYADGEADEWSSGSECRRGRGKERDDGVSRREGEMVVDTFLDTAHPLGAFSPRPHWQTSVSAPRKGRRVSQTFAPKAGRIRALVGDGAERGRSREPVGVGNCGFLLFNQQLPVLICYCLCL